MLNRLILLLTVPLVAAFGPAVPLFAPPCTTFKKQKQSDKLVMRVGVGDMRRRGSLKSLIGSAVMETPADTKQAIETTVVTDRTAAVLQKMNWKRRKAMLRKVRALASAYDVDVPRNFGSPPTLKERQASEQAEAEARRPVREAHNAKMIEERDNRVAARKKREAGSDAEKAKLKAIRADKKQAEIDAKAAAEAETQAQLKAEYDARIANEEAQGEADAEAAAAALAEANRKNQESQAGKKAAAE